MLCFPATKTE
ncbi:hypothetical protein LINGRAHAP2_LOCUS22063 [Linum grandiflorum]